MPNHPIAVLVRLDGALWPAVAGTVVAAVAWLEQARQRRDDR
jgi:predicted component of type VI protein secretion system